MNHATDYDAIVIGAGLSGLAAGIRLAHFGQRVLILEMHHAPGGLNGYYRRGGHYFDAGLHAMTNFAPAGARGLPLTKLLRQLRIRHQDLDLIEQDHSSIVFSGARLRFDNNPETLRTSIADVFPEDLAGFDALLEEIAAFDGLQDNPPPLTARQRLGAHLSTQLLIEMLMAPMQWYGSASEKDMDWAQFCIMWNSIMQEGFCRPRGGMESVIKLLLSRARNDGAEIRFSARVQTILTHDGSACGVQLQSGEHIHAKTLFSSAGAIETRHLCDPEDHTGDAHAGRMAFVELVLGLGTPARTFGMDDCIRFFCRTPAFSYQQPADLVSSDHGVLCCPNNFRYDSALPDQRLRLTLTANPQAWADLLDNGERGIRYRNAKKRIEAEMIALTDRLLPGIANHVAFTDLFTPVTITRYTGHIGGAVYGSPQKHRTGQTPHDNLYLIGTDQGFLGIIGAMLSGISIANRYGLATPQEDTP